MRREIGAYITVGSVIAAVLSALLCLGCHGTPGARMGSGRGQGEILAPEPAGIEVIKKPFSVDDHYTRIVSVGGRTVTEATDQDFLRLGDTDVLLPIYEGTGNNVSNSDKTMWALGFHVLSDYSDFVLVLRGKDGTYLIVPGVEEYVEPQLKKNRMIPDSSFHHSYWQAESIDKNVVVCHLFAYGAESKYDGRFKIGITETLHGIDLKPYPLNTEGEDVLPITQDAGPAGCTPLETGVAAPAATSRPDIVKKRFAIGDRYLDEVLIDGRPVTRARKQNFLRLENCDIQLPMHTATKTNVSNAEKTMWALNQHDEGYNYDNDFDLVVRGKNGSYLIIPNARQYVRNQLEGRGIVPNDSADDWYLRAISIRGDVVICGLHTIGANEEYDRRVEIMVRETEHGVALAMSPET